MNQPEVKNARMGQTRVGMLQGMIAVDHQDPVSGDWRRQLYTPQQGEQLAAQLLFYGRAITTGTLPFGERIEFAFTPENGRLPGQPPREEFIDV